MSRRAKRGLIPEDLPVLRTCCPGRGLREAPLGADQEDPYKHPIAPVVWRQIITSFKERAIRIDSRRVGLLCHGIREGLLWLDDIMDGYCAATCPDCDDPCCTANGIYYNRADLLYLLGLHTDLPVSQTRSRRNEPCRYLTAEGCMLPRICRPFICVWYLCEPQMALFQEEPLLFQRQFIAVMQAIRMCRQELVTLHLAANRGEKIA